MPNQPNKKPAVYYNQDDLTDYANRGGSIVNLFCDEINSGNFVVIEQKPFNAAANVLEVLKTKEDVDDRIKARQSREDWLFKILNPETPAQS